MRISANRLRVFLYRAQPSFFSSAATVLCSFICRCPLRVFSTFHNSFNHFSTLIMARLRLGLIPRYADIALYFLLEPPAGIFYISLFPYICLDLPNRFIHLFGKHPNMVYLFNHQGGLSLHYCDSPISRYFICLIFFIFRGQPPSTMIISLPRRPLGFHFLHFLHLLYFRPKIDFGARNALFRPKSLLGPKGLHFHQNPIGFISIRGMGTEKCTFAQKVHFGAQSRKKCKNAILEPKSDFWSKNRFFGHHGGQMAKKITGM